MYTYKESIELSNESKKILILVIKLVIYLYIKLL